ncbi:hypothetical protein HZY62_01800 [Maribacter polysiphoniae]|uniref:DUF4468 domain-containing protein n=1 Tax=Maribacter polysiphoniae TaxID=429344 RepID=A0A316E2H9_9FLAO|nr:hypothetical protein [Maribacter polysiphoniae]MBD1259307.1 hypothetical protein [Maribacter polysiphoniae]PWK24867.1 hypothetical protein LX92_01233 [Maribacter polysiphoniae]
MKKITFIIFFLITSFSFSQNLNASKAHSKTTVEEYNYMTRGYKIQISSGLDMKSGYSFDNLGTIIKGNYSFNFQILKRNELKEMAGILIIANSKVSGKTYYLALPFNNDILLSHFESDINRWDESMTTAFVQAMSELTSKMIFNCQLFTEN